MSIHFSSPWIHQLKLDRAPQMLYEDFSSDIAIVGAGIAGVTTAYFALKETNKTVSLVEATKVAHGATGHNAGQIVSYFEHPFADLVKEYGLTLAARAQEGIYYAWDLIEEIYADAKLTVPLSKFTGYAGCSSVEQILLYLKNIYFQRQAGLNVEEILVVDDPWILAQIPEEYKFLYATVEREYVLNILQTDDTRYIAALASRKGCVNSALFCEELVDFLLKKYPNRFNLFEHSPVKKVTLLKDEAELQIGKYILQTDRVILCTNGFENFTIDNQAGKDIDAKFHELVIGRIGYMAGYLEKVSRKPVAISYFPTPSTKEEDPYFYFTRRAYEHKEHGLTNLVCIGGPEEELKNKKRYKTATESPAEAGAEINTFMKSTYKYAPGDEIDYIFRWHGLMGYTPNGLRCIGPEPLNKVLMYNLGCNGVGILSSIYGAKRISQFLNNHKLESSIFDPVDQRLASKHSSKTKQYAQPKIKKASAQSRSTKRDSQSRTKRSEHAPKRKVG